MIRRRTSVSLELSGSTYRFTQPFPCALPALSENSHCYGMQMQLLKKWRKKRQVRGRHGEVLWVV